MDANIVILAGGASSRMKDSLSASTDSALSVDVKSKAKSMLPAGESDRPFLDYLLFNIQQGCYKEVVLVVGEKDESIREYYENRGRNLFPTLTFAFVRQLVPPGRIKPLGTADALLQALEATPSWRGKRLTVCNSDNLYSQKALQLLLYDEHRNATISYEPAALQFPDARVAQFAVMTADSRGFLTDIIEKPPVEELRRAQDEHRAGVSMNVWRFSYDDVVPFLKSVPLHPQRNEKELPLAVREMVKQQPDSVFTLPLAEQVIDLTRVDDLASVNAYLQQHFPHF